MLAGLPTSTNEDYNHNRVHSALGYHPPNELEEGLLNQDKNEMPSQALLTPSVNNRVPT